MLFRSHVSPTDELSLDAIIRRLAAEAFRSSIDQISPDATPENTMGWDSLGHMNLIVSLEDYFGIRLTAKEIISLNSLEQAKTICAQALKK